MSRLFRVLDRYDIRRVWTGGAHNTKFTYHNNIILSKRIETLHLQKDFPVEMFLDLLIKKTCSFSLYYGISLTFPSRFIVFVWRWVCIVVYQMPESWPTRLWIV